MEKLTQLPPGVQIILLYEYSENPLLQKYILVKDATDRGLGTGVMKIGLPGGALEKSETYMEAAFREIDEEVGLQNNVHYQTLQTFGFYPKARPNGLNSNVLLVGKVTNIPKKLRANDTDEVSEVLIVNLTEIIQAYERGEVHEGSMRLILLHLLDNRDESLNTPVEYMGKKF